MKKLVLFFFLLAFVGVSFAQRKLGSGGKVKKDLPIHQNDSLSRGSTRSTSNKSIKNKDATIDMYSIVSPVNDTIFVDTTLTIQKEYKYNYLRKDNIELLSFNNLGQTYNSLGYDFANTKLMPLFGARAKHFNFFEAEDINYYHVPTPLTELMYKSAFEQGQLLDAFFTVNTSKQFNVSVAYKGLRSLGKYQHILTSTGNFRFTTSYKTKNQRYVANAHVVMQDILNEENGGIIDDQIVQFETGAPDFKDRSVFDVNFEDAENMLKGKRYYLDHKYYMIKQRDSVSHNLLDLSHTISLDDRYYEYTQTNARTDYFGEAFNTSGLKDKTTLEQFYNRLAVHYSNNIIGDVQFGLSHTHFNYGYNKLVSLTDENDQTEVITNRLKGQVVAAEGKYTKTIGGFNVNGAVGINISGDFDGNYIQGEASIKITDSLKLSATINHNSKAPNYNYLLYQSDYINYNWQNSFKNINAQNLRFAIASPKYLNASLTLSTINNYTYFSKNDQGAVKPFQAEHTIAYAKLRLSKEFRLGKFALNNTVLYQTVKDDNKTLNVPEIITRNTFYYTSHLFDKALYLQTGVTFNYFTKYNMNAYDPALAEFFVQNQQEYGNFPRLDFFVNGKVRQTRIYLKAEHFNSAWTGYDYYAAPNYPYRDFIVRFGVVWNFFL